MSDQSCEPAGERARHVALQSSIIQPEALYTAEETAWYLRISKRTLERWRADGRGPRVTRLWQGGRPFYLGRHIFEAINVSSEAAPGEARK